MNLYTIYEDKILYKRIECISVFYAKGVKIVEGSDSPSNQLRHIMLYAYIIVTMKKQRNAKYIGSEILVFCRMTKILVLLTMLLYILVYILVIRKKHNCPAHIKSIDGKKLCRTERKTENIR